jgi:hypothetical protein
MVPAMRIALGRSRLGLIGVAAALLVTACTRSGDAPDAKPAAPVSLPSPPRAETPLNRTDILQAVGRAASAYAAGAPYPASVAELAGRRFEVAAPFGCDGPSENPRAGYSVDPARRSLTLTVYPVRWTEGLWVRTFTDQAKVEALEGFWLRWPWLASSDCPAKVPLAAGAMPSPETVGLVRVFDEGGSRLMRRGDRPYQITVKAEPDDPRAVPGFRLVMRGRIAEAGGRPIRCRSGSTDQRPTCLLSVEFEQVAFQDWTGEQLAEWRK